jgi:hypothetical protein
MTAASATPLIAAAVGTEAGAAAAVTPTASRNPGAVVYRVADSERRECSTIEPRWRESRRERHTLGRKASSQRGTKMSIGSTPPPSVVLRPGGGRGRDGVLASGVLVAATAAYVSGEVDGLDHPAGFEVLIADAEGRAIERITPAQVHVVRVGGERVRAGFTAVLLRTPSVRAPAEVRVDPVELAAAIEQTGSVDDGLVAVGVLPPEPPQFPIDRLDELTGTDASATPEVHATDPSTYANLVKGFCRLFPKVCGDELPTDAGGDVGPDQDDTPVTLFDDAAPPA